MQMIVLSGSQLSAAGSSCDSNEKAAGSAYEQPGGRKQKMLSPQTVDKMVPGAMHPEPF